MTMQRTIQTLVGSGTYVGVVDGAFVPATDGEDGFELGVGLLEGHKSVVGAVVTGGIIVGAVLIPGIQNLASQR